MSQNGFMQLEDSVKSVATGSHDLDMDLDDISIQYGHSSDSRDCNSSYELKIEPDLVGSGSKLYSSTTFSLTGSLESFAAKAIEDRKHVNDNHNSRSPTQPGLKLTANKAFAESRIIQDQGAGNTFINKNGSMAAAPILQDVEKAQSLSLISMNVDSNSEDQETSDGELGESSNRVLLSMKQYRVVIKMLKNKLVRCQGSVLSKRAVKDCMAMVGTLEEKYEKKQESKIKKASVKCKHPQTLEEFSKRLQGTEEGKRPWAGSMTNSSDIPALVMRAWDEMSQCQIKDYRSGFLSGGPGGMLDTHDRRQLALTRHSDWGNRYQTPFISTSSSLDEIAKQRVPHFQKCQLRKEILDNTKLTLINTCARLAAGKPVLRMKDELIHYNVKTKCGGPRFTKGSFFENEYLLPYSSGPDEIVGTWAWHDVEKWIKKEGSNFEGWYKAVGVAAFEEHERVRLGGTPVECKTGCDCCGK